MNLSLRNHLRWLLPAMLTVALWTGFCNASGTDVIITVRIIGNGDTTPPEGNNVFFQGNFVDFTATPADGWYFNRWIVTIDGESDESDFASMSLFLKTLDNIDVTAVFTSNEDLTPVPEILLPYGDTTIAPGESVNFQATASDGNPPYTYLWDFDGAVADSTKEDPGSQVFSASGVYTVTLTVFDDDGDSGTDSVTVTVTGDDDGGGGGGGGGGGCFIDILK